ncbi:MAG TPA: carboxylesterase family protein, partial [Ilumatobacteraceae bacterium]
MPSDLIVTPPCGALRGAVRATPHGDVRRFAGIPYGNAPVGDGRFRAATATARWEGTRPATSFGADPMQASDGPFSGAVPGMRVAAVSEDCLTINVWSPAAEPDEALPVMVWMYGGAFVVGGTSAPTYDGARLAAEQHVVVVSFNYRVGSFGFLDLRSVPGGETADTNCGLRDQRLALDWVHDNVTAFGGDVDRITVFGESGGAGATMHLLTTPGLGDVVRGAIVQSPGIDLTQQADIAAHVSATLLDRAGVTTVAGLRALEPAALLGAQLAVSTRLLFDVGTMVFHPVVDDTFVTTTPSLALARGDAADISLVIGHTADELRLFPDPRADALGRDGLTRWTRAYLTSRMARDPGEDVADRLVGQYLAAAEGTSRPKGSDVWAAISGDGIMRMPVIRVADSRPAESATYVYQFSW